MKRNYEVPGHPITDLADARVELDRLFDFIVLGGYRNAMVEHPLIAEWLSNYLESPAGARSLLLCGPTGTGKTWAAYGAFMAAALGGIQPNRAGRYMPVCYRVTSHANFLDNLRPGRLDDPDKYFTRLKEAPLLIVDELGAVKYSDWVEKTTFELIQDRRAQGCPTIYTTNLPFEAMPEALGSPVASRLAEQCDIVDILGEDRRIQMMMSR